MKAEFRGGLTEQPNEPPEYSGKIYPESDMYKQLPASAYYFRHTENVVFDSCETIVTEEDVRKKIVEV